ncbi:MAG: glycoside hydrolase family 13 protein [Clostridia bacterium]|nr:glycoside hydrolase family 13 protein [Clostridia bacterium]
MNIIFNSRDDSSKNPFGAVKTEQEITFRIRIYNDVYVDSVFLVLSSGESYRLLYEGAEGDYSSYVLNISFAEPKAYFYEFHIRTEHGLFVGRNDNGTLVTDESFPMFQQTVYDKEFVTPGWAKGKIMYQIFPDRFAKSEKFQPLPAKNERIIHENWNNIPMFIEEQNPYLANDYFCGNLRGIIEKLDYLKALGVGIIYLNPVFESAENHRYSTADYQKIDPYLGTEKDFTDFTKACHKRDIRVVLDGVFSHTGADSVYFNKFGRYDSLGAYQSQDSPYYSWYGFSNFPSQYESWWGFKNLPNVKEDNEAYLDYITNPETGVLKFWHDRGVDGWRLDVADELPDVFIDRLRKTVKQINPEGFIIGEVWEDASNKESYGVKRRYLLGNQLDSVMNYPFRTAIIDYVKNNVPQAFISSVMTILENYPSEVLSVLMNSLGTHDTKRIITELGVCTEIPKNEQKNFRLSEETYQKASEMLKLATLLQFTLPGIPCIYYGDEVGSEGFADPYCRKTYPYGQEDTDLLNFYRNITAFHQQYREEFDTPLKKIIQKDGILSFERGSLTVYCNAGNETCLWKDGVFGTLVFSEKSVLYNEYGMMLPSKSFAVFCKS